jgi:hypothetical protein
MEVWTGAIGMSQGARIMKIFRGPGSDRKYFLFVSAPAGKIPYDGVWPGNFLAA